MKTKIILLIISCLSVWSIRAQEEIQYEPFFGKDSTEQYSYLSESFSGRFDYERFHLVLFLNEKFPSKMPLQMSAATWYDQKEGYITEEIRVSYSEGNSKLWRRIGNCGEDSVLLMDLNLALGDSFEIAKGEKILVEKVFWENGRKHIQFDLKFLVETDTKGEYSVGSYCENLHLVSYEFVEGVGPLYIDITNDAGTYLKLTYDDLEYPIFMGTTIRSIVKDGVVNYIHPLWKDDWDSIDFVVSVPAVFQDKVEVFLNQDKELIVFENSASQREVPIYVYDLSGNKLFFDSFSGTTSFSLSSFPKGVYIVRIGNFKTKIILP